MKKHVIQQNQEFVFLLLWDQSPNQYTPPPPPPPPPIWDLMVGLDKLNQEMLLLYNDQSLNQDLKDGQLSLHHARFATLPPHPPPPQLHIAHVWEFKFETYMKLANISNK